jgi:hypothetical protein
MVDLEIKMMLPQYEREKRLTVEDLKDLWDTFKKGETAEKKHDISCFCPDCLFLIHKLLPENKGTKVIKRNFFIGFVVLATQQEKERDGEKLFRNRRLYVDEILPEIDAWEFCGDSVDVLKNGLRYLKIVEKACEEKIKIINTINSLGLRERLSPNVQIDHMGSCKIKVWNKAQILAVKKLHKRDQDKRERVIHHIKRAIAANQNEWVSERELQRRTGYKKHELDWLLSFCEGKTIVWDRFGHKISLIGEELNNPLGEIIEEIKQSLRSVGMVK